LKYSIYLPRREVARKKAVSLFSFCKISKSKRNAEL